MIILQSVIAFCVWALWLIGLIGAFGAQKEAAIGPGCVFIGMSVLASTLILAWWA